MVTLTCDVCNGSLPDDHYELFRYTTDDDGYEIELSWDLCSSDCLVTQALQLGLGIGGTVG